jgi:phage protein D
MAVISNLDVYAPVCQVEIEGERLPEDAVISTSVDESMDAPAKFEITMNESLDIKTQKFVWLDSPLISPGHKVSIGFGYAGKQVQNLIIGTIKALSPSFQATGIPSLAVEGYDLSHRMHKVVSKVNDVDVKYSDIAEELATKHHALKGDCIEDSEKTFSKVERREGEKDYEFLRRLADEIGFEIFVRGETLYFRKPKGGQEIIESFQFRRDFISFVPRLSTAPLVNEVVVCGWDKAKKKKIKASVKLSDVSMSSDMGALAKLVKAAEGSEPKVIEDRAVRSEDEARSIAEVEIKKSLNAYIQGTLECVGDPRLRPGVGMEIAGLGEAFSGNYRAVSARHTFGDGGYKTTLEVRRDLV